MQNKFLHMLIYNILKLKIITSLYELCFTLHEKTCKQACIFIGY